MLESNREEVEEESLIHKTAPSLIKNGDEYFCAFSLSHQSDSVPNLYIQNLANSESKVIEIKGAEIFVDFIPLDNESKSGYLYYMTESFFLHNS